MNERYRSRPLQVAEELRRKYNLTYPPINAGLVIVDYPIRVTLEDWNEDISGVFVRGHTINHIGLNKNHSLERRHFTLWHEFYHFYEHKTVNLCEFKTRNTTNLLEREADVFAAHFLMPEDWVRDQFKKSNGNTRAMAQQFLVSVTAMQTRLVALRLTT